MSENLRLYLDEDASSRALIKSLRSRNIDVLTVDEAGYQRATDEEQLQIATQMDRTILSFNRGEFVALHTLYIAAGKHHAGIIVSQQGSIGVLLNRLLKLMNARSAAEMRDWLEYLSNWR